MTTSVLPFKKNIVFLLVLCFFSTLLIGQHKIPFSALTIDNEGVFGVGMGNQLPDELCSVVDPPYFANQTIMSADLQNNFPGFKSGGHLRNDILGGMTGFPMFQAALVANGLDLTKINMRFSPMVLDEFNWMMMDGIDTRMYEGGQFQLVYIDGGAEELILGGEMPRLRDVVNYHNFANCFDDQIYGDTEYFIPNNQSAGSSPAIQALANALLTDIGLNGIKIQYNSIQPAIVGTWNVGTVYSIPTGVIVIGKAPMMDLSFEFLSFGLNNQCNDIAAIASTGSGNWLDFRIDGGLVASILDSENMGMISASLYPNFGSVRVDGTGLEYLDRNMTISPQVQPSSGEVLVRLYFSQFEWDNILGANDGDSNDIHTFDDMVISKMNQICASGPTAGGVLLDIDDWGKLGQGAAGGYFVDVLVTSFSTFFIHGPSLSVLPVEWVNFTANLEGETTQLKWTVANEVDNDYYTVEHSKDGKGFYNIKQLTATNEQEVHSYSFVHKTPNSGINYYRIKQLDVDGSFSYSTIKSIFIKTNKDDVNIYPNPITNTININSEDIIESISLIDINGQLIKQISQNTEMDVSNLASGIYFVVIQTESNVIKRKVLKM